MLTPFKSPCNNAGGMCFSLGGDIEQEVIGQSGVKFHKFNL